jgi:general secretion pathway protein G
MQRGSSSRGFTLLELMVVVAIIATLAAVSALVARHYITKAKVIRATGDIEMIYKAIVLLESDTEEWPGHQKVGSTQPSGSNEIWDLSKPKAGLVATDGKFPNWHGPYLTSIPLDPWGNPYFFDTDYKIDGVDRVVLGSFGPNGKGRNVYDDDNIIKIIN